MLAEGSTVVLESADTVVTPRLGVPVAVRYEPVSLRVRPETSRWIAEFSEHEAD